MPPPSMSTLPLEFIVEILTELPVKSLVRFLCVSKSWYAVINKPDFIKKHLKRSTKTNRERTLIVQDCERLRNADPLFLKFEDEKRRPPDYYSVRFHDDGRFDRAVRIYQPLRHRRAKGTIVNACNGLVCLYNLESEIAIWNPLIRKYRKLPFDPIRIPSGFEKQGSYSAWNSPAMWSELAFGHDPFIDDYKVVKVSELCKGREQVFEVKVYSLRAHSWRRVNDKWPKKGSAIASKPAFLNGALHWLAASKSRRSLEMLVALDLATEKFRMCKTPFKNSSGLSEPELEVLGGYLCVCTNEFLESDSINVWVMKKYGVESSWTLLYTILREAVPWSFHYCKPLVFSKNGEKILMQQDHFDNLFWYDVKEGTGRKAEILGMPEMFRTATCVGSLVLLDGDSVMDVELEEGEPEYEAW
ncbi:F-box protein CPR1-like [Alnus glutinosa]|uniref:F-box protein CPR1-like n=1 Tax=Alnus glutinosa TaxID=3517 RepID=UPI002D7A1621|nr:F-box protein CPR1-like [Alnus glutinosa]